jgi:hypothetical protein
MSALLSREADIVCATGHVWKMPKCDPTETAAAAVRKLTAEVQNLLRPRSAYRDPTLVQRVIAIMAET